MARMTGGQALVKSILGHGVDTIFGLPGVQVDHLFNALHDEGNAVRVIHTRHEQGAGYMAFGYAAASGRVGVYAVVPGPGLLNTTAALATAYGCNTPVLALAGQIPSDYIGRGFGLLHEIPDQLDLVAGLTKWAARIEHPSLAPDAVAEAFKQLRCGRVRPVELEMAMNVMARQAEVELLAPIESYPPLGADPELIDAAADLLGNARSPMIFVGGGAVGAEAELLVLAEMLQAPVVSHRAGRGRVSDRHYLGQTQMAGARLWPAADVILALGTRLQHQRMSWRLADGQKLIRLDIDPTEINRMSRPAVGIVADARQALGQLVAAVADRNRRRDSREQELVDLKRAVQAELEAKLAPQMAFLKVIRQALPDDGIVVDELTQVSYVARVGLPIYRPRTMVTSGYQGTLGCGYAAALGAKVANPDVPVLSLNGDGGFMYNVAELATAVQHGIDVVAVVFNDGAFGNVRRMQQELHGGRVIASELRNPDFVALAESFGAGGWRADSPQALGAALRQAFAAGGPSVIDVPVGAMPDPWPTIMPQQPRAR